MAKVHGKDTVFVIGDVDMSSYFRSVDDATQRNTGDTTVFGQGHMSSKAGQRSSTLRAEGLFDDTVGGVDEELDTYLQSDSNRQVTVGRNGLAAGNRVALMTALHTAYTVSSPVDDAVRITAEAEGQELIRGVSLHDLTEETATADGTSVQRTDGATSEGGMALLHVTANDRDGTFDLVIEHSTDGMSWATLATFTQVGSGTTAVERVDVAEGTTVNAYLRASWTIGGTTGGVTFTVGFGRKF